MAPPQRCDISDITTLDLKFPEKKEGSKGISGVDFSHDNGVIK